jgi:hypothetical protein
MKDKTGTPRPWLFRAIRVGEAVGLFALLYGLAASQWLVAVGGAATIIASLTLFRRRFPEPPPREGGSMGMSGDGGD